MSSNVGRTRLSVNMTVLMRMALEDLAGRNGIQPSTQATMLLRQALDRTMQSAAVQSRYGQHLAKRTAREWRNEQTEDWQIETSYTNGVGAAAPAGEQQGRDR